MSDDTSRGRGPARGRGQVHTLEAFTAALLVVSGVLFALQTTAVTPLTASTSNQHVENQHRTAASDLLASAAQNRTLRPAVTYWDPAQGAFVNATGRGYYANGGPPNAFGDALNQTFGNLSATGRRIAYNVYVRYRTPGNATRRQTMVYMGSPSDNAATATRTVALYDDTSLSGAAGNVSAANFYAPDAARNSSLYNVVEVQIVVWQM
ncbi:DUF7288 family protein [Halorussus caseinilyticus]|uniref:Uncharacterized protein n=1 Tax=Halorussus caseinilyticus TaxID=3034025 RepID=A0ABD5WN89_9EURY|nr:hypothetical protein [Halorussus sp. DT72]